MLSKLRNVGLLIKNTRPICYQSNVIAAPKPKCNYKIKTLKEHVYDRYMLALGTGCAMIFVYQVFEPKKDIYEALDTYFETEGQKKFDEDVAIAANQGMEEGLKKE